MRLDLAFGKTGMTVQFPDSVNARVLEARSASPLPDAQRALEEAMDAPIGCPPLGELARGKRTAAISVCDITRPAPNRLVLPPLLRRLREAGIGPEATSICIATGLHRAATDAEIREILGEEIAGAHPIINHNARALEEHAYLGTTVSGTPVHIDRRFMEADLHITLGFIEPHLMLGFSGGRKLIAPGLAAQETIKVLHGPGFMRDARAVEGSVADNPLHRELLEIARMARHDFMVDVALTRTREIAGVFAGQPERAHAEGMAFVSKVLLETLESPADAVLTTAAGYPLDLTFYQAIKGITAASHVVRPGGRILLAAACEEGAGAAEFTSMLQRCATPGGFLDLLSGSPVEVDQWQLEKLALVARRAELLFYVPGLEAELQGCLWGRAFGSMPEAISALLDGLPREATVALLPEGPYVLAKAMGA